MAGKISVALCTYQGADYVAAQLASIFAQTVLPDEVVIGDDGSTDETLAIIRELATQAPAGLTVNLAHTTRVGGVTPNFARTIAATTGDYIFLSDQDDLWLPDRVAQVLPTLTAATKPTLVFADANLVGADGTPLGLSLHESLRLHAAERAAIANGDALEVFLRRNLATGAATAFTADLVPLAVPFPNNWVHDEWLAIMASIFGTVVLHSAPVIDYRQHGNNQIGVDDPSLSGRWRRMWQPRDDRLARLAYRSAALLNHLLDKNVAAATLSRVTQKVQFEQNRASYPSARWRRLAPILRQVRAGTYPRFASQGNLDLVRDLLQPAGVSVDRH